MSGMICVTCGAPVEAFPGRGFDHLYGQDRALCEWLQGLRDDGDPGVSWQLESLLEAE